MTASRGSRWLTALFSFLFLFYLGTSRGQLISSDEILCYEATRSLWIEGRPSMQIQEGTHTSPGRNGATYSAVNSGQSILCLPLFAMGRALDRILTYRQCHQLSYSLSSPPLARNGLIWGGELELVCCAFFNGLVMAALSCFFFVFSLRLGASQRNALAATLVLAFTSYPAGYSGSLFTQPVEALGLLASFYFLFRDRTQGGSSSDRWLAGLSLAIALQCRYPALLAIPGLLAYHLHTVWQRRRTLRDLGQTLPFLTSVALGFAFHALDQYWKFGSVANQAAYADPHFTSPLWLALCGFLVSPGYSIFLYTPLLLLAPWTMRHFARTHPAELACIGLTTATYVGIMGSFEFWHGLWCYGPRYTVAFTPLLLLPLGPWLNTARRIRWVAAMLFLVGGVGTLAHLLANSWLVTLHQGWLESSPMWAFLFQPEQSMPLAQLRALWAWDYRVDFWLLRVYRNGGWKHLLPLLTIWFLAMTVSLWFLRGSWLALGDTQTIRFRNGWKIWSGGLVLLALATTGYWYWDHRQGAPDPEAGLITQGVISLRQRQQIGHALAYFDIALQRNPSHYGALFQRARALTQAGHVPEARAAWTLVLERATQLRDSATIAEAQLRFR